MTNKKREKWMTLVLMLREISEKKGITQQQLADRTGLKSSNISRVFSLNFCPTLRTFLLLADAMDVSLSLDGREITTKSLIGDSVDQGSKLTP